MSIAAIASAGYTQLLQASNLSGFQQAVQTLGKSLNSGNVPAAQTALKQIQQLNSNQSSLGSTANTQLATHLSALGTALQSGSLDTARTAFASVQTDLANTNAEAITAASDAAAQIADQIDAALGIAGGPSSLPSLFGAAASAPDIATETTTLLSGVYGNHSAASASTPTTGTNVNVSA